MYSNHLVQHGHGDGLPVQQAGSAMVEAACVITLAHKERNDECARIDCQRAKRHTRREGELECG